MTRLILVALLPALLMAQESTVWECQIDRWNSRGPAETSELFRQARAIAILLKPATFFHCNSTVSATFGLGRRAATSRRSASDSEESAMRLSPSASFLLPARAAYARLRAAS